MSRTDRALPGRTWRFVAVLFVACSIATGSFAADDVEKLAKKIEGKLMAPCCGANTVAQHHSGAADEARRDIRRLLAAGQTEQQVLDYFVEKHGAKVLALPPDRGFNLVAYLLPLFVLLGGAPVLYLLLRRWRAETPETRTPTASPVEINADEAERLRQAIRDA